MIIVPHFWQHLPGWFWEPDAAFYAEMVHRAPSPAKFVEVGCWLGKSTAFLAVEIINSGKAITLDCVDTWKGSEGEPELLKEAQEIDLFASFWHNMRQGGVQDIMRPIMLPSVRAARCYDDGELDFVYLDAGHRYEDVAADIQAWRRTIKKGGVLAGHDWDREGVRQAVQEAFHSVELIGTTWWNQL